MSDNDAQNEMRIQRHASLIDQSEVLRGLRFSADGVESGPNWEFMVFATNVNTRNEILVSAICTKTPEDYEENLNRFFQFSLDQIVLTPDSLRTLSQRLCRASGDPNWGAE